MFTQGNGTVTDETLMEAVRKGELAKLGMLFERHHRALFDFLVRMTGNASTAEEPRGISRRCAAAPRLSLDQRGDSARQ